MKVNFGTGKVKQKKLQIHSAPSSQEINHKYKYKFKVN